MSKTNVTLTTSTPPVENMKTKGGTAKPSGKIGKGGAAASPTTGGSLKPGKGKKK